MKLILGIVTYNRLRYLKKLLSSFLNTYNKDYEYTIIIADDGSTDGTLEYLDEFNNTFPIIIIKNSHKYIAGQTNSILKMCSNYSYDIGFIANDDIEFTDSGWDIDYVDSILKSGYDHLVYFNKNLCSYKAKLFRHNQRKIKIKNNLNICSKINYLLCMGCFWTFTPRVISTVGYFNTGDFIGSGYSHIEYTLRCCRAGFNKENYLYDVENPKIIVYCEDSDKNYNSVKDNNNISHNYNSLNKTISNKSFIYYCD